MLDLEKVQFDYTPYPIGLARPVIAPEDYRAMVETFPRLEDFVERDDKGVKYSLSRHNNRRGYRAHIESHDVWRRFYAYVRSPRFIQEMLELLRRHYIDLGIGNDTVATRMVDRFNSLWKGAPLPHFPRLSSRFEFSAMPIAGGSILPHTDNPTKIITLVVSILDEDEWDASVGGGTSIVVPKDDTRIYNNVNDYMDFDEVDMVKTFPFEPNQSIIFVKTYNSWHAVWPMTGDDPRKLRRTLTINIESS
jgi:hypothetical protein